MKPIINRLSPHAGPILFPLLYLWKKKKARLVFILFFSTIILTGCFQHFFRTGTLKGVDAATIQRLQSEKKYFILHSANKVMAMKNFKVRNETVEANLDTLSEIHSKHLYPNSEKANAVKARDRSQTLVEVHMYYGGRIDSATKHFSAPVSDFSRVDVYEFDPKTTTFNHVMSGVGIVAGVLAAVGIIALIAFAIACNCPQVFVDNGAGYGFVSGVYSGSIYKSMERTDYLLLPPLITDNEFRLKIANVKNEKQYINSMQLMKVQHSEGVKVLADRHGKVFTYKNLQAPASATMDYAANVKKLIATKDNESYSFNSSANENGFSDVTLVFQKPADAQKAKFVVHGGNSLWSGYIYHRFAEMFGDKYEAWRNQKDKSDPKEMEQWQKDQALPLMVYVEKNGKWEPVDYFAHTGNTATRDMIMEIDLSDSKNEEVKIKLETAYQFWNLDYAAIDFSANEETTISYINASSVVKTGNEDQKDLLKEKDNNYCQLQKEEDLSIVFTIPGNNKSTDSYFLISTGYYHNTMQYEGPPDLKTLNSLKTKGSFDSYSRKQFSIIEESLAKTTNIKPSTGK